MKIRVPTLAICVWLAGSLTSTSAATVGAAHNFENTATRYVARFQAIYDDILELQQALRPYAADPRLADMNATIQYQANLLVNMRASMSWAGRYMSQGNYDQAIAYFQYAVYLVREHITYTGQYRNFLRQVLVSHTR